MNPIVMPLITTALSLGQGIMEGARGKRSLRAGLQAHANIPEQDPGVRAKLAELTQKAEYANNGQGRMLTYKRDAITDAGVNADLNIQRSAGDSPGGGIEAILRNRNVTAQSLARAGAESEAIGAQYTAMTVPLVSDIADRTMSLRGTLRDHHMLNAAQREQNSNGLIWGALATATRFAPSLSGGGSPPANDTFSPPMVPSSGLPFGPGLGGDSIETDWTNPAANPFSLPDSLIG